MKTTKMLKYLIIVLITVPGNLMGQTKFSSNRYTYSFIIPEGWYQKDQINNPDVDAKIVDGKGNSFIVSIKTFPTSTNQTAKQQLENTTNQQLEEQFNAVYGETKIVKRGTLNIGQKEFYYFHMLTPYIDGYKLYHKMFYYSEGFKMMTIDGCSIETYLNETSPAFAIMISTFEFSNLKNK